MVRLKHFLTLLLAALLAASLLLGGCAADEDEPEDGDEVEIGSVTVMGVWGGGELESFEEVAAGWEEETGGQMDFEGTRDLTAILRTRVAGGNPPDVAILPNPALMKEFAADGELVALDDILDMDQLETDYSDAWIDLGTVNPLYGLFVKAFSKSSVFYNPKTFEAMGWEVPETWDELVALSDEMVAAGETPWSIGTEAGGATGWAATDWIQEIYLAESGPDMYDQWTSHEIPWTDPSVKSAWEKFGQMALTDGYVAGGADAILATTPDDSTFPPFEDPPTAHMCFLGTFAQGVIEGQFPDAVAGEDFDFFDFPPVDPMYPGAATGGADVVVVFNDTPSSRSFVRYLAQAESWESWVEAGGFTSPNSSLDTMLYADDVARNAAEQLTMSQIFRFDADDLMPGGLQSEFFSATGDYLQNPDDLDTILADLEALAVDEYAALE